MSLCCFGWKTRTFSVSLTSIISTFLVIVVIFTLVELIILQVFILVSENFALFRISPNCHPGFIIIIISLLLLLFLLSEFVRSEVLVRPASASFTIKIWKLLIVDNLILITIVLLLLLLLLLRIGLILFILHIKFLAAWEVVFRETYLL